MDRCEYAVELKHKGYNCAQAVLCAFADELIYTDSFLICVEHPYVKILKAEIQAL